MRIDRSHLSWLVFLILATGASGLLFLANFYPRLLPIPVPLPDFLGETPPSRHTFGGTPLGLIFGSIAFVIFLFASALGVRKKKRLWPIGSVRWWLKAHIWLTTLTIPLVAFHCGFHSGGIHTSWLLVLYVIVMGSGFFGLALQQFMPRLMKERLSREVVFEEIPYLRDLTMRSALKLRQSLEARGASPAKPAGGGAGAAEALITTEREDPSAAVLARFLDESALPYLSAKRGDKFRLADSKVAADTFRTLKLKIAGDWQRSVDEVERWCEERRMMDLQTKYQHWLHGWLFLHVPVSFALLVMTGWHAWVAIRFLVVS